MIVFYQIDYRDINLDNEVIRQYSLNDDFRQSVLSKVTDLLQNYVDSKSSPGGFDVRVKEFNIFKVIEDNKPFYRVRIRVYMNRFVGNVLNNGIKSDFFPSLKLDELLILSNNKSMESREEISKAQDEYTKLDKSIDFYKDLPSWLRIYISRDYIEVSYNTVTKDVRVNKLKDVNMKHDFDEIISVVKTFI